MTLFYKTFSISVVANVETGAAEKLAPKEGEKIAPHFMLVSPGSNEVGRIFMYKGETREVDVYHGAIDDYSHEIPLETETGNEIYSFAVFSPSAYDIILTVAYEILKK